MVTERRLRGVPEMPYKKQIVEIEREIENLRAVLDTLRQKTPQKEELKTLEKLLGELARLNAERTRLLMRQHFVAKK